MRPGKRVLVVPLFAPILLATALLLGCGQQATPSPTPEEAVLVSPTEPPPSVAPVPTVPPPTATSAPTVTATEEVSPWQGPYFGQTPPGRTPEVFAPGIISTEAFDAAGTFSPDGTEFFFTRRPSASSGESRIWYTRQEETGWTTPTLAPFACNCFEFEPHISPDGTKLFFGSRRPLPGGGGGGAMRIWVAEKATADWGEPQPLDWPLSNDFAMYVSTTNDGTIYTTGADGIYRVRYEDGQYLPPERLDSAISDLPAAAHPFIAPDESYLIFDAQVGGEFRPSLFITFRQEDGSWSMPQRLGEEINANDNELCASVSPDGKHLFFTRIVHGNADIYWVDAQVLEDYRP